MNYLLVGNETYQLNQRKNQLIEQYGTKDDQMNICYYDDQADSEINDLIIQCQTCPFLADYRIVIYEDPSFFYDSKALDFKQQQQLIDYLNHPAAYTVLIIILTKAFNSNSVIYKKISKFFTVEKFQKPDQKEFLQMVKNDISANKIDITSDGLDLLLSRLDNDVLKYKNELAKLLAYQNTLDYQAIDNLISQPLESDIFKLTKAINDKDLATSLKVYRDLLSNSKNDVLAIIGLLASQYRLMVQVKTLAQLGYDNGQIAGKLQMSTGSVYYKLKDSSDLSLKNLLNKLYQLAELDEAVKSGAVEPVSGLELFIIRNIRS
ncbi:MAG: DNA polymerase III subunit delta [Erysipelotrichaceae bacterium]